MNKKPVAIGLDLGIASVGWCITDLSEKSNNTFPIILHGARLFNTMDEPGSSKLKNESRREARSVRRRHQRAFNRKRDFIKYLIDKKIIDLTFDLNSKNLINNFVNLYINKYYKEIQAKYLSVTNLPIGIHNLRAAAISPKYKLDKNEIIVLLYFYLSLRGAFFDESEETEISKINEIEKSYVDELVKKEKYPINIAIEYYKQYEKIRSTINLLIPHKKYVDELKLIFDNQNIDFIKFDEYASDKNNFFSRQRSYAEGPGNKFTFTKYGLYADKSGQAHFHLENGIKVYEKQYDNLWDKNIGKCSYFEELFRAPKKSLSANIFDLVNKLTDWKLNSGEIIPKELKNDILLLRFKFKDSQKEIESLFEKYSLDFHFLNSIALNEDKIVLPILDSYHEISKIIQNGLSNFEDYIINDHNINNLFDKYKNNFNDLLNIGNNDKMENILNFYDSISYILNKYSTLEDRGIKLREFFESQKLLDNVKNEKIYSDLAQLKGYSGTSSLSFAAYYKFIPILRDSNINYSTIAYQEKENMIRLSNDKNFNNDLFSKEWIDELIASPTIKRSLRQSLNTLKEIFKYCRRNNLDIKKIVVELTRSSNNKQEKDNITNFQKYRTAKNKEIIEKYSLDKSQTGLIKKLWLLEQQKCLDAYSGEYIDPKEVIMQPNFYDEDHIIPKTLSFDDSYSNLVLIKKDLNAKKLNTVTPIQFIKYQYGQDRLTKMISEWNKWYVAKGKSKTVYTDIKKYNKLLIENLENFDNTDFINRNLSDTSYITSAFMNHLTLSNSDFSFKVISVNGKQTSSLRRQIAYSQVKIKGSKWLRPDGFKDLEQENFFSNIDSSDIKNDVIYKDRSFNGHHAEDAYFLTIISQYYEDFKKIERSNINLIKGNNKLNSFEKNELIFNRNSRFNDHFLVTILNELNTNINKMRFSKMINTRKNLELFNKTIYSAKIKEGNLKVTKKLNLLSEIDADIKIIKEYFEETKESKLVTLNIYNYDRNLYENLKCIWQETKIKLNSSNNKKKIKNFFKEYILNNIDEGKITFNDWIPIFDKNGKIMRKVSQIKYLDNKLTKLNNLIFTKDNNKIDISKRENFSFYDSYNWVQIWLYKNKNNKYAFVSIDARVATFIDQKIIVKNEKIKNKLDCLNIDIDAKPVLKLEYGDLFLNEKNEIICLVGRKEQAQKFEFDYIKGIKIRENNKKDDRYIVAVQKHLPFFKKISLSYLGEIQITNTFVS